VFERDTQQIKRELYSLNAEIKQFQSQTKLLLPKIQLNQNQNQNRIQTQTLQLFDWCHECQQKKQIEQFCSNKCQMEIMDEKNHNHKYCLQCIQKVRNCLYLFFFFLLINKIK
jgi:membrane protease subunit (stomatin/prohibitin family)